MISNAFRATILAIGILVTISVLLAVTLDVPGIEGLVVLAFGMCMGLIALHYAVQAGWYPR